MMQHFKVYVTDARHTSYEIERALLQQIGAELCICNCASAEEVKKQCADADALLLDMAPADRSVIDALTNCKIISRYGVGFDNVDIQAAREHGILVTNVPDYCVEDVSDHALALIMACMRDIARRDRLVRNGAWNIQRTSYRLCGKTLGLLGFGRISRALARKFSGMGLEKILIYDPYIPQEVCEELGVQKAELEEVLRQADILSLHMPVTEQTRGMIDRRALGMMKSSAILVNSARGALVDDEALIEALEQHKILCAGLDTHNHEPLPADSAYLKLDNVILTDHTAYSTVEAVEELKHQAAQNVVDVLLGKRPKHVVNP